MSLDKIYDVQTPLDAMANIVNDGPFIDIITCFNRPIKYKNCFGLPVGVFTVYDICSN